MDNKIRYLEKLFEYITSFIINRNIINRFHEKVVEYDNIDDKSYLDYQDEQSDKNINDVYEFIESFLKTSELQSDFDEYLIKLKRCGYKLRDDLLSNPNVKIMNYILDFYEKILTAYFDYENKYMIPIYINMYYEYLICTSEDDDHKVYNSIVKGAGPILLKVLQEFPTKNKNFDKDILLIINTVFDSLTSITGLEIDVLLPYMSLKSINPTALKVGSIGQVHYATSHKCESDNNVIVKFVKPRSLLYFLTEIHMLINLKYDTSIEKKSYNYIKYKIYKIAKEFSFREEFENANILETIYNYKCIQTVKMIEYNDTLLPYLIMEVAKGIPLQNFIQDNITMKSKESSLVITNELLYSFKYLVHLWMTNLILGNGYLHADLHPGNILIDTSQTTPVITVIDFGNVGKMDINQQQYIFQLFEVHMEIINCVSKSTEVKSKCYEKLVNVFSKFSKIEYDQPEQDFLKCVLIENYEIKQRKVLGDIIQELISKSSNAGEIINGSIVDFGRGLSILECTWKKIDDIQDLVGAYSKILTYSPYTLLRLLCKKIYFTIYKS